MPSVFSDPPPGLQGMRGPARSGPWCGGGRTTARTRCSGRLTLGQLLAKVERRAGRFNLSRSETNSFRAYLKQIRGKMSRLGTVSGGRFNLVPSLTGLLHKRRGARNPA